MYLCNIYNLYVTLELQRKNSKNHKIYLNYLQNYLQIHRGADGLKVSRFKKKYIILQF